MKASHGNFLIGKLSIWCNLQFPNLLVLINDYTHLMTPGDALEQNNLLHLSKSALKIAYETSCFKADSVKSNCQEESIGYTLENINTCSMRIRTKVVQYWQGFLLEAVLWLIFLARKLLFISNLSWGVEPSILFSFVSLAHHVLFIYVNKIFLHSLLIMQICSPQDSYHMYSSLHSTTTTGKKPFYYIFFTFKCNYLYHFYQFVSSRLLENKHIPKQQPERKRGGYEVCFFRWQRCSSCSLPAVCLHTCRRGKKQHKTEAAEQWNPFANLDNKASQILSWFGHY